MAGAPAALAPETTASDAQPSVVVEPQLPELPPRAGEIGGTRPPPPPPRGQRAGAESQPSVVVESQLPPFASGAAADAQPSVMVEPRAGSQPSLAQPPPPTPSPAPPPSRAALIAAAQAASAEAQLAAQRTPTPSRPGSEAQLAAEPLPPPPRPQSSSFLPDDLPPPSPFASQEPLPWATSPADPPSAWAAAEPLPPPPTPWGRPEPPTPWGSAEPLPPPPSPWMSPEPASSPFAPGEPFSSSPFDQSFGASGPGESAFPAGPGPGTFPGHAAFQPPGTYPGPGTFPGQGFQGPTEAQMAEAARAHQESTPKAPDVWPQASVAEPRERGYGPPPPPWFDHELDRKLHEPFAGYLRDLRQVPEVQREGTEHDTAEQEESKPAAEFYASDEQIEQAVEQALGEETSTDRASADRSSTDRSAVEQSQVEATAGDPMFARDAGVPTLSDPAFDPAFEERGYGEPAAEPAPGDQTFDGGTFDRGYREPAYPEQRFGDQTGDRSLNDLYGDPSSSEAPLWEPVFGEQVFGEQAFGEQAPGEYPPGDYAPGDHAPEHLQHPHYRSGPYAPEHLPPEHYPPPHYPEPPPEPVLRERPSARHHVDRAPPLNEERRARDHQALEQVTRERLARESVSIERPQIDRGRLDHIAPEHYPPEHYPGGDHAPPLHLPEEELRPVPAVWKQAHPSARRWADKRQRQHGVSRAPSPPRIAAGLLLAGLGAWLLLSFLPSRKPLSENERINVSRQAGVDENAWRFPPPIYPAAQGAAALYVSLGFLIAVRGLVFRRRIEVACKRCGRVVVAERRALALRCESGGHSTGTNWGALLLQLAVLAVTLGLIAVVVMAKLNTDFGIGLGFGG